MELKTTKETENKSMKRRDIEFYIMQDDRTPTKAEVKTELCKKLNLNPDATAIVRIDQSFGAKQCTGLAHAYADAKSMKQFEQPHLAERGMEKKKKEGGQKEEAKAEKPAEAAK